jgi:hypothetical protein
VSFDVVERRWVHSKDEKPTLGEKVHQNRKLSPSFCVSNLLKITDSFTVLSGIISDTGSSSFALTQSFKLPSSGIRPLTHSTVAESAQFVSKQLASTQTSVKRGLAPVVIATSSFSSRKFQMMK